MSWLEADREAEMFRLSTPAKFETRGRSVERTPGSQLSRDSVSQLTTRRSLLCLVMNGNDPFGTNSKSTHRPSLSTLINSADLSAATSSLSLYDHSEEDSIHSIELPDAPDLSHRLFEGEDFDPSEFLLGRRHTGLEDLRSEVSTFEALLYRSTQPKGEKSCFISIADTDPSLSPLDPSRTGVRLQTHAS